MENIIIEIGKHAAANEQTYDEAVAELLKIFKRYTVITDYVNNIYKNYRSYAKDLLGKSERKNYEAKLLVNELVKDKRNLIVIEDNIVYNHKEINGFYLLRYYVDEYGYDYLNDDNQPFIVLFNDLDYTACIICLYYFGVDRECKTVEEAIATCFNQCKLLKTTKYNKLIPSSSSSDDSAAETIETSETSDYAMKRSESSDSAAETTETSDYAMKRSDSVDSVNSVNSVNSSVAVAQTSITTTETTAIATLNKYDDLVNSSATTVNSSATTAKQPVTISVTNIGADNEIKRFDSKNDDSEAEISVIDKHYHYDTTLYIAADITESSLFDFLNTNEILTFLQTERLTHKVKADYKRLIMSHLTPTRIYNERVDTDVNSNKCSLYLLFRLITKPCKIFSLQFGKQANPSINSSVNSSAKLSKLPQNQSTGLTTKLSQNTAEISTIMPSSCYGPTSNWLEMDQHAKVETLNAELIRDLKLFDLEEDYHNRKNEILREFRENSYGSSVRFKYLSIKRNALLSPPYRSVIIADVLQHYASKFSNSKSLKSGTYPMLTSIATNNGVYRYVDKYDAKASIDNKIISIGLRKTGAGCCFVHTYYFAHSREVALFTIRNDTEASKNLNAYNIAFAINAYCKQQEFKRDLTYREILQWKILVITSK